MNVGDYAKRDAEVKKACLLRNIGSRKAMMQEASDPGVCGFSDDLTRTVAFEAVDHNSVEPGDCLDVAYGSLQEFWKVVRLA